VAHFIWSWLVFLSVPAVFVGSFEAIGWYFSNDQRTKRALRRLRPTKIVETRDGGMVKLVGRVRFLSPPLEAPFSGRPCAQYRVIVEGVVRDRVARRGGFRGWSQATLIHEERAVDFLLEDGTGCALVRMACAAVAVDMDYNTNSGIFRDPSERVEALLARHGQKGNAEDFNRRLRCREGVLEENDEVAVLGRARYETDADPGAGTLGGYREDPRRLVIGAPPGAGVLVSDDSSVVR
jgi:hypothetical protein